MKKIEGFLWLALFRKGRGMLFGPDKHGYGGAENFGTNGLCPFVARKDAFKARAAVRKKASFTRLTLAHLSMEVAKTKAECYKFRGRKNLIVLEKGDGVVGLLERLVAHDRGIFLLGGMPLSVNGFKTFSDIDDAFHVIREVNRQGHMPATLATFKLKRL